MPDIKTNQTDGRMLSQVRTGMAVVAAGGALLASGVSEFQGHKFADLPGPLTSEFGRTVNSLSVVLAGVLAQELEPQGAKNLFLTVEKPFFPDAEVLGTVTGTNVDVKIDLALTSARFVASGSVGALNGKVEKSEFNWDVAQNGADTWAIGRFGFKFDKTLHLSVKDGVITGFLENPLERNWQITGRHFDGHMSLQIQTGFLQPNFSIKGRIEQAPR